VDNDFDLRALESLLARLFTAESYSTTYSLLLNKTQDPAHPTLPEGMGSKVFMEWAHQLPEAQVPSWLGLPEDSDIVLLTQQARVVLDGWLQLQASQAEAELAYNPEEELDAEGPKWSRTLRASIENWLQLLPKAAVSASEIKGEDPIQRCVAREATLAAQILNKVRGDLTRLHACLGGEEQTTNDIRELLHYLRTSSLPPSWRKHHAVPPKMKVDPWIGDLVQRLGKLQQLVAACTDKGLGSHQVWLGGLFQPGAFLTATRQWTARVKRVALESLRLSLLVGGAAQDETQFLVDGAFLYGAKMGDGHKCLVPGGSQSTPMPVLQFSWLVPAADADKAKDATEIPIYLTSERGEVFASVQMKVEATDTTSPLCWYEWGAAIALWAEP